MYAGKRKLCLTKLGHGDSIILCVSMLICMGVDLDGSAMIVTPL